MDQTKIGTKKGSPPNKQRPLIVDLDGTIIKSDLLIESFWGLLRQSFFSTIKLPFWLIRGKSVLKEKIAQRVNIDVSKLQYNDDVLEWLREEKEANRTIILSTASNRKYAQQVADYLDLFDTVQASTYDINLSSYTKRDLNIELFGEGGFDYAGNSMDDIPVWDAAANAILVHPSPKVLKNLKKHPSLKKIFRQHKENSIRS